MNDIIVSALSTVYPTEFERVWEERKNLEEKENGKLDDVHTQPGDSVI